MNAWTNFSASETLNMIRSLEMFLRWKRLLKESSNIWLIKRMPPGIFLLNCSLILWFRMLSSGYNKILISKWLNLFCVSLGPQTMQNHAAVFRTGDVLKEGCEKMDSIYKSMDDMKTFDRGQWRLTKRTQLEISLHSHAVLFKSLGTVWFIFPFSIDLKWQTVLNYYFF